MSLPSRQSALELVHEHVESESLRRHMYAVEACCRAYAREWGEDEDLYGLTGLVHDFDYERFPDRHPLPGAEILRAREYPEPLVRAVLAHNEARTSVKPETLLDRTLYACDEITGLVTATALVRPSRSLDDLKPKSVMKKFKDRAFAAGVDRDELSRGAELIDRELRDHVAFVVEAMRPIGPELGLERGS